MQPVHRRQVLKLVGGTGATLATLAAGGDGASLAQKYPDRAIKLVSPYAPAGATEIIARLIGQWMAEQLGTPVVVENRPGGGANIGTEAVVRAPADGYTMLLVSSANAVNPSLYPNLAFNFLRDIEPVACIGSAANVLVVHPSLPVKTTAEFIGYLKANPGRVGMGLAGTGSPQHLSAELFKTMTGTDMLFVQYKGGGPVINDLLGGHVQAAFAPSIAGGKYLADGRLRGLGVTSAERLEAFPDVPSLGEAVKGYEATNFYGIGVPRGTPGEVVATLNRVIAAGLADSKLRAQFVSHGVVPSVMTPGDFGSFITAETGKWGAVIKRAGITAE